MIFAARSSDFMVGPVTALMKSWGGRKSEFGMNSPIFLKSVPSSSPVNFRNSEAEVVVRKALREGVWVAARGLLAV
jgi:hypothetical protein